MRGIIFVMLTFVLAIVAVACTTQKPVACTLDAKACPDGSFVGRIAPNCEFAACPVVSTPQEPQACTMEAKLCPDGSAVGRQGPDCEFAACPENITAPQGKRVVVVCTEEQKKATMCTLEYMAVCGSDGIEYGNKCGACAAGIDSYTQGECPKETDEIMK